MVQLLPSPVRLKFPSIFQKELGIERPGQIPGGEKGQVKYLEEREEELQFICGAHHID